MNDSKESMRDKARKPVGNKTLGVVYIILAILVFFVGYIAHLTNSVGFALQMPDDVLEFAISQMELYFLEYTIVGFFTGIFLVLGLLYLRKKTDNAQ